MGYRVNKIPPKPEDMLPIYSVRNGATLYADFECYYMEPKVGHDPHLHDYLGWPDPHHPDEICQMPSPRDRFRWRSDGAIMIPSDPVPIDLTNEEYNEELLVVFDHPDELIMAHAWIDDELPYLIKMVISPQLPMFEDKPIEKRFTLFARRSVEGSQDQYLQDAVVRAKLVILPGAPSIETQDEDSSPQNPGGNEK